jgi:rhamnosyltransferase
VKWIRIKTIEEDGVKMTNIKKSDVSVIIRTKNEERWVGHCIQSVIDQLNKPEIIIVDNNSTDKTLDIVRHFIQEPKLSPQKNINSNFTKIKILKVMDYTPGKSINYGVSKASSNYIMVISAHCVLNKVNLQKHKKDLNKYISIFGNQIPKWNGKKISKRYMWSHFGDKEVKNMYSKLEKRYFFHNAIAMYKKKSLKKEPFNPNLLGKEDRYWANKVIKKRKSILYDPKIEVDHHYTLNGNTWKGIG